MTLNQLVDADRLPDPQQSSSRVRADKNDVTSVYSIYEKDLRIRLEKEKSMWLRNSSGGGRRKAISYRPLKRPRTGPPSIKQAVSGTNDVPVGSLKSALLATMLITAGALVADVAIVLVALL